MFGSRIKIFKYMTKTIKKLYKNGLIHVKGIYKEDI